MIASSQVEWHGLIAKEGRGIDDADLGNVREVHSDSISLFPFHSFPLLR